MVLRPKPEKVEERERIRLALLHATVSLAAKHGFAGLGLREVARGADIAPTSFYRHFGDMEELGLSLIRELLGPLLARWKVEASRPSTGLLPPAQALIDEALRTAREEPDLMHFLLAERVGAVVACRAALRKQLSELAFAVRAQLAAPQNRHAWTEDEAEALTDAAVALLLAGCADTLDLTPDDTRGLDRVRRKLEAQLHALLVDRSVRP